MGLRECVDLMVALDGMRGAIRDLRVLMYIYLIIMYMVLELKLSFLNNRVIRVTRVTRVIRVIRVTRVIKITRVIRVI